MSRTILGVLALAVSFLGMAVMGYTRSDSPPVENALPVPTRTNPSDPTPKRSPHKNPSDPKPTSSPYRNPSDPKPTPRRNVSDPKPVPSVYALSL